MNRPIKTTRFFPSAVPAFLAALVPALLAGLVLVASAVRAAEPAASAEKDPLRATLMESREKNRGVTIHASGASIAMVVTAVEERHVVGKSQQSSRIVIRLDHIDGVSAAF